MAKTNTPSLVVGDFAAAEMPTSTRVDPTTNPFYAAVQASQERGQAIAVQVTDMKVAHSLIRRAATALDVGIKIRPSLTSAEAEATSAENPTTVTFQTGAKRGSGKNAE